MNAIRRIWRDDAPPGYYRVYGKDLLPSEVVLGSSVLASIGLVVVVLTLHVTFPAITQEHYDDAVMLGKAQARADCVADAMAFPRVPVWLASSFGGWQYPAARLAGKVGIGDGGGGGTLGYYDGGKVVLLVERGYAPLHTLSHELAHVAHHHEYGAWYWLWKDHGLEWAEHYRLANGAMAHCAVTGDDPEGWDGYPLGNLIQVGNGEYGVTVREQVPWRTLGTLN